MTIEGLLFLAAFCGITWLSLVMLRYTDISITRFSIPSVVVLFFFFTAFVGVVPLYFGLDPGRVRIGVVDEAIILIMFVYSSLTLLLMIVGFIFARQVMGLRAGVRNVEQVGFYRSHPGERVVFMALFGICVLVLLLYLTRVPEIALLLAIQGSIAEAMVARSAMGNAFEGAYWRYQLFFGPLLTMCCVYFYTDSRLSGSTLSRTLFLVSLPIAFFSALMAIEKAPVVNLIAVLYLAYAVTNGGNYWQPALKYVLLVMISILAVLYATLIGESFTVTDLTGIISRIFTGGITPAYFYLEVFPTHINYLYGTSFPNPGSVLPFTNFPLTTAMMEFINPAAIRAGITGSAPTVFWAEMYANFGPIGVVIAPLLIGIGLYAIQHVLNRTVFSPVAIATMIMLASHFKELAATGIASYLFDTTLFAIVVILVTCLIVRRLGQAAYDWYVEHRQVR